MSDPTQSLTEVVAIERGPRSVAALVEAARYPLEAVYAAAFTLIDRCWVHLDRPDPTHVRVTLRRRSADGGADEDEALAREFAEELVSCAWRGQVAQASAAVLERAFARASAGEGGPPSLDDLARYDFTEPQEGT